MIVYLIQTNAFGSKILKYASTFFSVAYVQKKKLSHLKNTETWHQAIVDFSP